MIFLSYSISPPIISCELHKIIFICFIKFCPSVVAFILFLLILIGKLRDLKIKAREKSCPKIPTNRTLPLYSDLSSCNSRAFIYSTRKNNFLSY